VAERCADGMRRAWETTERAPLSPSDVAWIVEPVALPPAEHLSIEQFKKQLMDRDPMFAAKNEATKLAWLLDHDLRKHGTPFKTEFQRVELDKSIMINRTWPCQVITQWKHPLTSETREFRSNYLLFDPTPHLKTKDIMVFVDKDDPEKYLVYLSFIPDLDN